MKSDSAGDSILIVDDMSSNLDLLEVFLGDSYTLKRAASGEEVFTVLEGGFLPDIILLDIVMDGIDGFEVCRRLKADKRFSGIPVIFLSALKQLDSKTKGFDVGAVDYITKPFESAEVLSRVKTHLALKKARIQLMEQNEKLKKTMELKETVDRIFQHDLKGPLTAVLGGAQILSGFIDDEEQLEIIEGITQAGMQILKMINFSLDLYKMEQGIYRLNAQPVSISNMAELIVRQYRNNRLFKKIEFHETVSGRNCRIAGEEMLIYSMLMNLVQNAAEAAYPDGRVDIGMECADSCKITVKNSGEVPEAIRENFFEKFVTMGKDKGTGLGTYAAKLISQLHGGTIQADFTEKDHTTISVELPLF
ncbi:MAG: hybrid sensor histidine kinase/response regulator [Spirochaetales bacterium]|nr:hybrid sensor histidine kinase/response regulator [Spirochaetales bacterium]